MNQYIDDSILQSIRNRPEDSSKTTYGTLLSFVGSEDMPGAAVLSSLGALRSGLGLLKIAAENSVKRVLQSSLYEAVYLRPGDILNSYANAYLIGCGLGRSYDKVLLQLLPNLNNTIVLDADCLNFIATDPSILKVVSSNCDTIITPHGGEFSRLTKVDITAIEKDKVGLSKEFAKEYGCVVVLKGKNTVVSMPDGSSRINTTGNSGLATGGSGDVLAGVIASLCAQGYPVDIASCIAVYIHGLAADRLIDKYGKHGLLPRDLPEEIGRILG